MLKSLIFILAFILLTGCNTLFFYPMKKQVYTPQQFGLVHDDIILEVDDGTQLHGWHLRTNEQPKGSILFFHGNAENITTHIASVYWLPENGYEVFLFDYRGYGRSQGAPEIETVIADAQYMINYVFDATSSIDQNVIVFGQSLGGAISINATEISDKKIKALIIDSSFSGFREIAREKLNDTWITWPLQYPLSWLFTNEYSPRDIASKISPVPLLIMHGSSDKIIPIHHGKAIYQLAKAPKLFWEIENGTHISSMMQLGVRKELLSFLELVTSNNLPQGYEKEIKLDESPRARINLVRHEK